MTELESFIEKKYNGYKADFISWAVQHINELWKMYKDHVKDRHFFAELTKGDPCAFQQRYWEMILFKHLSDAGYNPKCHACGPDFEIEVGGIKTWIEAVAPIADEEIKNYLRGLESGEAMWRPDNAFTLRYTQAFASKKEIIKSYMDMGKTINPEEDACIIAINAGNLGQYYQGMEGKSRYPLIVDVTYGLGSYFVSLDVEGNNIAYEGIKTEPTIEKKTGNVVSKAYFRDNSSDFISAAIASNACPEKYFLEKSYAFCVVHNHSSMVKLQLGKLNATTEYFVRDGKLTENIHGRN